MQPELQSKDLNGRDHLGDLSVDGRIASNLGIGRGNRSPEKVSFAEIIPHHFDNHGRGRRRINILKTWFMEFQDIQFLSREHLQTMLFSVCWRRVHWIT